MRSWTRLRLPAQLGGGLPPSVLRIIGLLVGVNCLVWVAVGVVLRYHPLMISPAVLSYTLGLRHALDADHISAIDLMTRRLVAAGQRPVTVGTFFSLGHSTIVIVTCVVVAATSGALRRRFGRFRRVGGIIGTGVSAAFLVLMCLANGWILYRLVRRLRAVLREPSPDHLAAPESVAEGDDEENAAAAAADPAPASAPAPAPAPMPHHPATTTNHPAAPDPAADGLRLEGAGCMATVFRRLFRIVDRPWKMYPLGVLFGLGFDTSSEIAVLGIASLQGARGTSLWVILIFPALFTAGMCLLDTTDGALMMSLYTSKAFARDRVAILYYSVVLTAVTVVASAFIGVVQILSLIQNVIAESSTENNRFWEGLGAIGDHFDLVGGCICALFLVAGVASVLAYGPWRRRVERSRMRRMMMMGRSSSDSSSRPADPAGHSALSTA